MSYAWREGKLYIESGVYESGVEDATHVAFSFGDRTELGREDWHSLTEY